MQEYRVEKIRANVTLRLRGNMEIQGRVFLPIVADEPVVNRLHELWNGMETFVPVELDDERTVLQNKARVLWCRYDGPAGPVLEVMLPRRRVTFVLEDGTSIGGDLVANGPPDRRRVLDCINRPQPFLLIEARDADYVLHRDAIAFVPSAELGDPREEEAGFEMEAPETGAAVARTMTETMMVG